jgi:hypothetical protein
MESPMLEWRTGLQLFCEGNVVHFMISTAANMQKACAWGGMRDWLAKAWYDHSCRAEVAPLFVICTAATS